MNRTDRLVAILLHLQASGELRASDLAERFEVSVRTIYRDLEALSEASVPLVATPGKGYRLLEGYFLPPLTFTGPEAGILFLGAEYVRDRVDPELGRVAEDALHKLAAVLPASQLDQVQHWRQQLLFPRRRADDRRLGPIRRAIEERRVLRLLYHAYRRAQAEPRDVEPISLVFLAEAWHLSAYCRVRQAQRLFRLDRIDELTVLSERFSLADRHATAANSSDWRLQAAEARVRFDPSLERWVRERQPYTFLREEVDPHGPVFVYAMRDERGLVNWLLGWGSMAEVLEPPELRSLIAHEARNIVRRHAGRSSPPTDRTVSGAVAHRNNGA